MKEEMLNLITLKEWPTNDVDINNALATILNYVGVSPNKLISVVSNGAPALLGKKICLTGLLKSDSRYPRFIVFHCIVQCKHLAAIHFKLDYVIKSVLQIKITYAQMQRFIAN